MYTSKRLVLASSLSLLLIISIIPRDSYQYQQQYQFSAAADDLSLFAMDMERGIYSRYPDIDASNLQPILSGLRSQSMLISLDGLRFEPAGVSRVIVMGNGDLDPSIAGRVFNYMKIGDGYVASATISDDAIPFLQARGLKVVKDFMVTLDGYNNNDSSSSSSSNDSNSSSGSSIANNIDASRFSLIYNLDEIHSKGISGKGVRVAIVDSGVDFSSKDMNDALARDEHNIPIMLDVDAQGIVLTSARFIAKIVDGMIVNAPLPDEFKDDQSVSNVYVDDTGVYLNIKNREKGLKFEVYNPIYPYISPLKFSATSSIDWKIGNNATEFIQSKSGIYRMGFFLQLNFHLGRASLIIVPILLVDSKEAGVYDTVYADMSTAWADFALFELRKKPEEVKFDFDFTDERAIRIGEGDEMLVYDADNDGNVDLSAGMLGAYVLDVWGVISDEEGKGKGKDEGEGNGKESGNGEDENKGAYIDDYLGAVNGRLLEPVDKDGRYVTVMFDFFGHGTQSAGTIVSKGIVDYPVYESQQHKIKGIAPDVKIVPIKALWFGDIAYGWLWASGFEQVMEEVKIEGGEEGDGKSSNGTTTITTTTINNNNDNSSVDYSTGSNNSNGDGVKKVKVEWRWVYTGKNRADIINNSWGIPSVPILDHGAGYDMISMLATVLSIPGSLDPKYSGVLMVNSAGNSGHAYGTVSSPAASPLALAVGATTNNVIVGLEFTKKQPRFGNSLEYYDDIADFSSKGPTILGDVKPELLATGAYGFTPLPVNSKYAVNSTQAFGVFGGTSMAAPIASGSAALLIQVLRDKGIEYDPSLVRAILMSTARDLKYDPFTQGAGRIDPLKAIEYVDGREGSFIVYTDDTYRNYLDVLKRVAERQNLTLDDKNRDGEKYGFRLTIPDDADLISSKWYAGYIAKGTSKDAEFTIVNRTDERLKVTVEPTMLKLISISSIDGKTSPRERDPSFNSEDYGYIPNYFKVGKDGNGSSSSSSSIIVIDNEYYEVSKGHTVTTAADNNKEEDDDRNNESKNNNNNNKDTIKIGSVDVDIDKVKDADLMVAKVYYPFDRFMNLEDPLYANELRIASLYAYEWRDEDKNSNLTYTETVMINRAGAWGTTQHLAVREPFKRIQGDLLLGVYPVPNTISYWFGNTQRESQPLDYRLILAFYKKDVWSMVDVDGGILMRDESDGRIKNTFFIDANSKATFKARIDVARDAREGVYQGFITVSSVNDDDGNGNGDGGKQVTNIPVSFVVPVEIGSKDKDLPVLMGSMVDIKKGSGVDDGSSDGLKSDSSTNDNDGGGGDATPDTTERYREKGITLLYDHSVIAGAFDMLGRYNSGEWKYYHLNITDPSINALSMKLTWKSKWSSVDIFVVSPDGRIITTNVPGGVFKTFINWPSNDWLGRTRASDGGGFYPSQNNGENSTVLYVPVDSTGVYSVMLHTTLFSAEHDVYEPLQIEIKPAAIIPDLEPPRLTIDLPSYARGMIDVGVEVVDENIEELTYSIDDSPPYLLPIDSKDLIGLDSMSWDGYTDSGKSKYGIVSITPSKDDNNSGSSSSNYDSARRSSKISIDTSRLVDGPHTITIVAKDKAGHRSFSSAKFIVDNTPPTIVINGLEGVGSDDDDNGTDGIVTTRPIAGTLAFNVDVNDANLESFRVILPDGRVVVDEHEISIDTRVLNDGIYEVRVVAEDRSGNVAEAVKSFKVDNTPPVVSILEEDGKTVSGVLELRYSVVEENLRQLIITVDGSARVIENTGSIAINTKDLIDGRHRIEIIAEDYAGHNGSAGIEFIAMNYEPVIRAQIEDARITAQNTGLAIGLAIGAGIATAVVIVVMRHKASSNSKGREVQV
ncbi:MAG: S8 family serine peptidase [Candidatus Nitrosocaldus sp.]